MKKMMVFAFALLCATYAFAADFQIKGWELGASETEACRGAQVENHQHLLNATGVTGIDFPAAGCEVALESLAGLKPSSPAGLLFWKGRLIRLIVKFDRLKLSDAADLRTAFTDLYGKSVLKRSGPFRTDTWRSGNQRLELEWTMGMASVGVFLTDDPGWAEYERSYDRSSKALEAREQKRRSLDIRN